MTVLKAGPCVVVQRKTPATDGYDAVQLGLMEYVKPKRINKPATGHLKKSGAEGVKFLREFRLMGGDGDLKAGDRVLVDEFKPNEKVDVIGVSKGRGFAGVVKRHHFRGGDATHGSMFHRAPGSIGASSFPSRVFPGMRMGGQMGDDQVTVRNLEIVESGHRGQRDGGQGRGARAERRLRRGAEGEEVIMPSVDVIDLNNTKVGEVELADAVFGAAVNEDLLYEAVRHYLAGTRAGTHKVKTRHEVAGSGKKLWKQKGTGRARMGSIRSPLWRHGGTVHGPQAARLQLQAAAQDAAGRAALGAFGEAARRRAARSFRAFQLADHKTKNFVQALTKLEATKKVLLVETDENRNLELSARNLEASKLVRSREVHPYELLDATRVLLTQAAASKLSETLAKSAPKHKAEAEQ